MHDFTGDARRSSAVPGEPGRGARLRRRPRGRRARARGRERAPRAPARRRARQPPEDRGARAPLRAQGLARGRLQARPGGRPSRSSTSSSRPTSPARSRRSRTRSPSCRRTRSQVNIIHRGVGGINESDVMLAAASEARDPRLQRAPGRRRARRSPSARAWRSAPTRSSTARSTSCARRCRACSSPRRSRTTARPGRGPPDCSAPREIGTIAGSLRHRGQGHARRARCASCATARSIYDTTIDEPAALQRGRARGRSRLRVRHRARQLPGPEARATCSRPTRRARSSASSQPRAARHGAREAPCRRRSTARVLDGMRRARMSQDACVGSTRRFARCSATRVAGRSEGPASRIRDRDRCQDQPRPAPCARVRERARRGGDVRASSARRRWRACAAPTASCRAASPRELRLKRTPTLEFVYDDTTDRALRVERAARRERRRA